LRPSNNKPREYLRVLMGFALEKFEKVIYVPKKSELIWYGYGGGHNFSS
jgi:hypothetical protein